MKIRKKFGLKCYGQKWDRDIAWFLLPTITFNTDEPDYFRGAVVIFHFLRSYWVVEFPRRAGD